MEAYMNRTSFPANNCFEYLRRCFFGREYRSSLTFNLQIFSAGFSFHLSPPPCWTVETKPVQKFGNAFGACFGLYPVRANFFKKYKHQS